MIISISSSYIELIFVLLAELIAIQMQFSEIQFGETSLEGLFFWLYWACRNLNWGLDLG